MVDGVSLVGMGVVILRVVSGSVYVYGFRCFYCCRKESVGVLEGYFEL